MKRTFMLNGGRAIISGLAVSICIGLGVASLITSVLLSGTLPQAGMKIGVFLNLALSSFFGALIAGRGGDTGIAIRIAMVGGLYGLLLFTVGILVLDGPVKNLFWNLLCILFGCGCACAICIRKRKSKPRRKRAVR